MDITTIKKEIFYVCHLIHAALCMDLAFWLLCIKYSKVKIVKNVEEEHNLSNHGGEHEEYGKESYGFASHALCVFITKFHFESEFISHRFL